MSKPSGRISIIKESGDDEDLGAEYMEWYWTEIIGIQIQGHKLFHLVSNDVGPTFWDSLMRCFPTEAGEQAKWKVLVYRYNKDKPYEIDYIASIDETRQWVKFEPW